MELNSLWDETQIFHSSATARIYCENSVGSDSDCALQGSCTICKYYTIK